MVGQENEVGGEGVCQLGLISVYFIWLCKTMIDREFCN